MSPRLLRSLSDDRLCSRLALGEAAAFDELYRRYMHRLAAFGTQLLGDPSSGDDVAQVTLMRAYQSLRSGRTPSAFRAWLFRIAHNAAIDVIRTRRYPPTALVPERPISPRDAPTAGALVTAIASLPAQQQRVYVLRELHGLRIDETSAELGLSNQQVEQTLFAARNRLAEQLVFGERLSCPAVRRLADGPLDAREKRALKTHLRSCPDCRGELGARRIALVFLPQPSVDLLRSLFGAGATPAAAKLGVIVAAATIAAGVPIVAETHSHFRRPSTLSLAPLQSGPDVSRSRFDPPQPKHLALSIRAANHLHTSTTHPRTRRVSTHDVTMVTTVEDNHRTPLPTRTDGSQRPNPHTGAAATTQDVSANSSLGEPSPNQAPISSAQQTTDQNTNTLTDSGTDSTSGNTSGDGTSGNGAAVNGSTSTNNTPAPTGSNDTSTGDNTTGATSTTQPPSAATTASTGSDGSSAGSSSGTPTDGGANPDPSSASSSTSGSSN